MGGAGDGKVRGATGGGRPLCDFVLRGAGELVTLACGAPRRRPGTVVGAPAGVTGAKSDLGVIRNGAVAAKDGRIVWVGAEADLGAAVAFADDAVDLHVGGACVTPGFVDPHTHAVFAGSRAAEFAARLAGTSYSDILASGGGINSTVRATRAASLDRLQALVLGRLDSFLLHGTTTLEVKSGYGLTAADELKLLAAAGVPHPTRRIRTFLGAHFVPDEFLADPEAYVTLVCDEMLPLAVGHAAFADVFCDVGAFTVEQSRRVLLVARELGFGLKIHADELALSGGSQLAAELGCISADHLVYVTSREIAALKQREVVAVMLPGTSFSLGAPYAPARALWASGVTVALATDFNPGTCYCENMQMAIALACQGMRLTPAQGLRAATMGAAAAIGMERQVGSLEPGKWCDLLVLAAEGHNELGYHFGVNLVKTVVVGARVVADEGRRIASPVTGEVR